MEGLNETTDPFPSTSTEWCCLCHAMFAGGKVITSQFEKLPIIFLTKRTG